MSVPFAFLPIMPTYTIILAWADNATLWFSNVSDLWLLILCWGLLSGLGNEYVICLLGHDVNKYIYFGRSWQCSPLIVEYVKQKVVDTLVMHILVWGNERVTGLFGYHPNNYIYFERSRQWSHLIVECVRLKMVDALLPLIFRVGQQAWHLSLQLSPWPIHSPWKEHPMEPFDCRMCKIENR